MHGLISFFFFFLLRPNVELSGTEPNVDSPLNTYAASLWSNQEGSLLYSPYFFSYLVFLIFVLSSETA